MAQDSVTLSLCRAKGGGCELGEGVAARAAMLIPGFTLLLSRIPPWICLGEGWVSAGQRFLHMARIQHLGKDTPPSRCLSPLLPFQDTWGPVPDPIVRRCSGHLGPCLACSLPWSSHRASPSRQMLGTRLAEATPKYLYSFLSHTVLWGAQKATVLWQAGWQHSGAAPRCQTVPTTLLATSASWCLGQQPPWRSCFWKPEQPWRCPASSPSSGRCCRQPNTCSSACDCSRPDRLALCRGSNEIPAPVMCRQEQEGCFLLGAGCRGCAAGLEGHREAGRTVGPSQKQGARSLAVAGMFCAERPGCRSYHFHPRSPMDCVSCSNALLLRALCSSPSPSHPLFSGTTFARSAQELQLVSDSCFHPAVLLAPCPVSWLAHRDYLLSGSLFPPLFAVGKKPGGRTGSAWGG